MFFRHLAESRGLPRPEHVAAPMREITAPRSVLAVPGDQPRLMRSALKRPASALMLDLEDGVGPGSKDSARTEVAECLWRNTGSTPLMVRINHPASQEGERDLKVLRPSAGRIHALVVPKSTPEALSAVEHAMDVPIVALIESALGVELAFETAQSSSVVGLMFGTVDHTTDIASTGGWHVSDLSWAKGRVVNAAVAGGCWALAGPSTELDDGPGLERQVREDSELGFAGKLCIHPAQLDRVNADFGPSRQQLAWAARVLEAVRTGGGGAIRLDGEMIDKPVVDRARSLLAAGRSLSREQ